MANKGGMLKFSENFPNEESCIRYFEAIRWKNGVVSPFDPTSKVYKCKDNRYKCRNTGKYFLTLTMRHPTRLCPDQRVPAMA